MSISSLGLYPQIAGEASFPDAGQQAKGALAQASYQSSLSDYGQIQNSLDSLQSSLGVQSAGLSTQAPARPRSGYAPQESQLFQNPPQAGSSASQITQAVQSFVTAYNASGSGLTAKDSQKLASIGIATNSSGKLSLDNQAFRNALISQPGKVAQVFSSIADSVRQKQALAAQVQPNAAQSSGSPGQAQFASQPSSTTPHPAPKVENLVAPSLAAQYSIISKLG